MEGLKFRMVNSISKNTSIKKNFLMNVVLTMSSIIFPLITFPYASRVLLPAGTGKVSFATSVISYFSLFAQLGIPTYGIRACAKVRDNRNDLSRTAQELLIISLFTTALSYVALFISFRYVSRFQEDKTLLLVISSSIFLTTIGIEWLYRALEQYTYITIRSVIFKLIALIGMFLLVKGREDYVIYGFITIFAASASNILNLINAHKYIDFRPIGGYEFKHHLKPVAVFFAMACAVIIYTHLDIVMLGFMKTDVDVGYYNAAVKIKSVLVSVVTSLGAVILPRASYFIAQGQIEQFRRICQKALNFVILISIPLTLYFIIFAKNGILFLSGKEYMGSIVPMQVIMPTLLLIGITNILGIQILVPTGREKIVLYSEIAGALTDVVINAILIPRMASTGAAIGTLVAEAVVLLVQYNYLKSEVREFFEKINWIRILAGTVIAAALSGWVLLLNMGNFLTLLISGVIFFVVYSLFLLLRKEDLAIEVYNMFKSYIRKLFAK